MRMCVSLGIGVLLTLVSIASVQAQNFRFLYSISGSAASQSLGEGLACLKDFSSVGAYSVAVGSPGAINGGKLEIYDGATGTTVLFTATPSVPGVRMGASVAAVGDVGGSTLTDVLVGVPAASSVENGTAEVFYGPGTTGFTAASSIGADVGDATAGLFSDRDSGGAIDVIAGAPNPISGVPKVFLGDSQSNFINASGNFGDGFGCAVASIQDHTADGIRDLLVGVRTASPQPFVTLFDASDLSQGFSVAGDSAGDEFGTSIAVVGDVNGDGIEDFIVGAPFDDTNGSDSGYARLFASSMSTGPTPLCTIRGTAAGEQMGTAVVDLGDTDGSGTLDFAISAPGTDVGALVAAGVVHIYTFNVTSGTCTKLQTLLGSQMDERFGASLMGRASPSTVCDLDGDSNGDIGVGSHQSDFSGKASFYALTVPTPTPTPTATPTPTITATPTPVAPLPSSAALTFKIFGDGTVVLMHKYDVDPPQPCAVSVYGRYTRSDLTNEGPVMVLTTGEMQTSREDRVRINGQHRALCAPDNKPFVYHIITENDCGAGTFFSNVFARNTSCGLTPPLSIEQWEEQLIASLKKESLQLRRKKKRKKRA